MTSETVALGAPLEVEDGTIVDTSVDEAGEDANDDDTDADADDDSGMLVDIGVDEDVVEDIDDDSEDTNEDADLDIEVKACDVCELDILTELEPIFELVAELEVLVELIDDLTELTGWRVGKPTGDKGLMLDLEVAAKLDDELACTTLLRL